ARSPPLPANGLNTIIVGAKNERSFFMTSQGGWVLISPISRAGIFTSRHMPARQACGAGGRGKGQRQRTKDTREAGDAKARRRWMSASGTKRPAGFRLPA